MLFWIACIPSRIVLALLPLYLAHDLLKPLGFVLAVIATTFLVLWTFNLRLTAFEAQGPTWWHEWRLVHGLIYAVAAGLLVSGHRSAWIPLLLDVGVGLLARGISKP